MKFIVDKVEIVKKESEDKIIVDGKEVVRKVRYAVLKGGQIIWRRKVPSFVTKNVA